MYKLTINESGFQRFDELAKKLQSFDAPLAEIGAFLEFKAKNRFRFEQSPDGTKWAPLAPSTLRYKKTRAILRESGAMAASIAFRVKGNVVRVKPSKRYAIFHQLGTSKMPARPFMGFEPGDAAKISQILTTYLDG